MADNDTPGNRKALRKAEAHLAKADARLARARAEEVAMHNRARGGAARTNKALVRASSSAASLEVRAAKATAHAAELAAKIGDKPGFFQRRQLAKAERAAAALSTRAAREAARVRALQDLGKLEKRGMFKSRSDVRLANRAGKAEELAQAARRATQEAAKALSNGEAACYELSWSPHFLLQLTRPALSVRPKRR